MSTINEKAKEVPVVEESDVIVCGGGPAGISAAILAARTGAKVCLIDNEINELELIPIKRETYRYVPMGTPILRDLSAGFNVTYDQIWKMYEVDTYDVIDDEDGLNELRIIIQDSPWYLKLLLSITLLLLVSLFTLIIISFKAKVQAKNQQIYKK